jgi:hypothetical protein
VALFVVAPQQHFPQHTAAVQVQERQAGQQEAEFHVRRDDIQAERVPQREGHQHPVQATHVTVTGMLIDVMHVPHEYALGPACQA